MLKMKNILEQAQIKIEDIKKNGENHTFTAQEKIEHIKQIKIETQGMKSPLITQSTD